MELYEGNIRLAGRSEVAKIERLEDFDDEYVYDIGVDESTPYFFANGILVHNSCYFSLYPILEEDKNWKPSDTPIEEFIKIYDIVSEKVNETFPAFMDKMFNTGLKQGAIIAAGREIVASTALFIKKKKYAALVIDLEGFRQDVDGKPGKLKVMGLDMKRADTPSYMQDFLEEILLETLTDVPRDKIFDRIIEFRNDFRGKPAWDKGTPKKVNGITTATINHEIANNVKNMHSMRVGEKMKIRMAGHVRASMNWNNMLDQMNDKITMRITDGSKVVVCRLMPNNVLGMDSIAYPIDMTYMPEWFKELPFDNMTMEKTIINFKLENLLGVLDWDLEIADDMISNDMFVW